MGDDQGGPRTLSRCLTGSNGSRRPRVNALATNPRPDGVKKLEGDENAWRIRVGEFRIVYEIHDGVLTVMVLRVANRREAYR